MVLSDQSCDQAEECIGQALNDPGITHVRAYKAAFGSSTSFSGGEIQCGGSFSCHSMQFIRANTDTITCRARDSCSNNIIESNAPVIGCDGANSCSFSNITTTNPATLSCYGYMSCRNTYIHGVEDINAAGSLSMYKTNIDSIDTPGNTLELSLFGTLSGFGAKLICRENHICYINCDGFDSCYMFYTECIGQCIIATSSARTIAPTTNLSQFNNLNLNTINPIVISNDESCTNDTLNFDDYQEHFSGSDINVNSEDPICCRAFSSCREINLISFQTTNNNLICSGFRSCRSSNITSNNGTVYCEAQTACHSSSIAYAHDVYCTGAWSCYQCTIANVNNVVCSGHVGCSYTTFISNGSNLNVYFDGRSSGADVTLYCNDTDSCNIYCSGRNSCDGTILVCNENCNVECDATDSKCPVIYGSKAPTIYPSLNPSQTPLLYTAINTLEPTQKAIVSTNDVDTFSTSASRILTTSEYIAFSTLKPAETVIVTTNKVVSDRETVSDEWIVVAVIVTGFVGVLVLLTFIYFIIRFIYRKHVQEIQQQLELPTTPIIDIGKREQNVVDDEGNSGWNEEVQRDDNKANGNNDPVVIGETTLGEEEVQSATPKFVYNMNAQNDEIVIGDDETTGR